MRIPTYEAQVSPVDSTGQGALGASAFLANTIGPALSDIAQRLAENQRIAKEQQDNAWLSKSVAELRSKTTVGYLAAQQNAAVDGKGFTDANLKTFTDLEQSYLATAPSPEAAAAFQVHAATVHDGLLQDSVTYEAGLRGTAVKNAQLDALALNAATVRKDPNQFQPTLTEALVGIDKLAIPANLRAQLVDAAKATLAASALNAGIDGNPVATKQSLLDGKWAPYIGPADAEQFINQADTEIRRRQAEADRMAREAEAKFAGQSQFLISNEMAAAERGDTTGLVSDANWKAAIGDNWQLAKSNTESTRNGAIVATSMALSPPSTWQAQIDKAAPAPGKVALGPMPMAADGKVLPGELHLDPSLAPQVRPGAARPFAPGEAIKNPDGSWSSEITVTVNDPILNGGKPTVIPSLWLVDGKAVRVNEDTAARYAAQSGLKFQSFDSMAAAEKFATDRETKWQSLDTASAAQVAPLWTGGRSAPAVGDINYKFDAGLHDSMTSAASKLSNELATNGPADYVYNHSPDLQAALKAADTPDKVAQAVNFSLQLQTRMEIPPDEQKILPSWYAKGVVDKVATSQDPQSVILGQRQLFGDKWPRVFGELVKAGLPPEAQVFASFDGEAQTTLRINLAAALKTGEKDLRGALPSDSVKTVENGVADRLAPLLATLPAEKANTYEHAALLAAFNFARNGDADGAVKQATDAMLANWTFHGTYRVPVAFDGAAVDMGLHQLVSKLTPADVDPGDSLYDPTLSDQFRREQTLAAVQRDPVFVTNRDETGVVLLDSNLQPVTSRGKPIVFRFADAVKAKPPLPGYLMRQPDGFSLDNPAAP